MILYSIIYEIGELTSDSAFETGRILSNSGFPSVTSTTDAIPLGKNTIEAAIHPANAQPQWIYFCGKPPPMIARIPFTTFITHITI